MCFQYLGKFFGSNRRRSNAGDISQSSSLPNRPQVSRDTVRTVKSIKSSNAPVGNRVITVVNVGQRTAHSVNSLRLLRRQSVTAGSGGAAFSNNATAAAAATANAAATVGSSAGPATGNTRKRSSWLGFLGVTKKKIRSSNETL